MMDDMLWKITELLKEANDLIKQRNKIFKNEIINARIDREGMTILMDDIPRGDGTITYSKPLESIAGGTYYIVTKKMHGIIFEDVRYTEGEDNAKLAI